MEPMHFSRRNVYSEKMDQKVLQAAAKELEQIPEEQRAQEQDQIETEREDDLSGINHHVGGGYRLLR